MIGDWLLITDKKGENVWWIGKVFGLLFCFVFDLHYLCSVIAT